MKRLSAVRAAMPKGKGIAPLFLAFLLFHVEHFNVFNNREVMRLSLGAALADELVSDLLPVAVTTASFLAFVLLYRWNRFYVREKRGLAISCCLIAVVPVLWAVRDVVGGDASAMLGCLAMGLFAFGHLCFLPAVVKRLAAIGPAKTVFLYGMVLACRDPSACCPREASGRSSHCVHSIDPFRHVRLFQVDRGAWGVAGRFGC